MRYSSVAFGQASNCNLVFGTVITGTGEKETVPEQAPQATSSAVVVWNMVSCRLLYRLSLSPGPARFGYQLNFLFGPKRPDLVDSVPVGTARWLR